MWGLLPEALRRAAGPGCRTEAAPSHQQRLRPHCHFLSRVRNPKSQVHWPKEGPCLSALVVCLDGARAHGSPACRAQVSLSPARQGEATKWLLLRHRWRAEGLYRWFQNTPTVSSSGCGCSSNPHLLAGPRPGVLTGSLTSEPTPCNPQTRVRLRLSSCTPDMLRPGWDPHTRRELNGW